MNENDIYQYQIQSIKEICPEIIEPALGELKRNREYLNMIASENYPSLPVQYACSLPCFNTKYAEGIFPRYDENGRKIKGTGRYYGGCENIDKVEELASNYARQLFGADHAYVQPHSGADANLITYNAILNRRIVEPFCGRKGVKNVDDLNEADFEELRELWHSNILLSMELSSGGHLTHGSRQNISSKIFNIKHYPLDDNGLIDYEVVEKVASFYKPLILLIGYSAYTRKIDFERMREIADKNNSVLMVDMAHFAGLVAGGIFTDKYNPIPYADIATSTTHKTLRGPRGGLILCKEEWSKYIDKGCPGVIGGPLENQIAAKAIAFKEALSDDFKDYANQIVRNSQAFSSRLKELGANLLTNGTDNHIVIIDVRKYGLNGRKAEDLLKKVHITCNRNSIPNLEIKLNREEPWKTESRDDPQGAWNTSGIRLGTAALTTLGMKEEEMKTIAEVIVDTLKSYKIEDEKEKDSLLRTYSKKIINLLNKFPLYPTLTT